MSMEDWPLAFADYFGINDTTAALILSILLILTILLPVMLLARGRNAPTIWIITTFFGECIVLGLGWIPLWVMMMTIALTIMSLAVFAGKNIA